MCKPADAPHQVIGTGFRWSLDRPLCWEFQRENLTESSAQSQGILQSAGQKPPEPGILLGELCRIQTFKRRQHIFGCGPAAGHAPGIIAGEGGPVVAQPKVRRICQGIMEVQRVARQFVREKFRGKALKALFVSLICKKEDSQADESQQKDQTEKQLFVGKT